MSKFVHYFSGSKVDESFECLNRVHYIRSSCKRFAEFWKNEKEFLSRSFDNELSKTFREFRNSEIGQSYRTPEKSNGDYSILNEMIDQMINIHTEIDEHRKVWLKRFREISDDLKKKQGEIREIIDQHKENYEKAVRKLESAETNLKKLQNRVDSSTTTNSTSNSEERLEEMKTNRFDCENAKTLAQDQYLTEIYRISNEEFSISKDFFFEFLLSEEEFYSRSSQCLSQRIPKLRDELAKYRYAPIFSADLVEHCRERYRKDIAYPIEMSIHLLKDSLDDEGLFRLASGQTKQKKLVAQLDLQLIDLKDDLNKLNYDSHVPANVLKQYLRELPQCLLTNELLPQWNEISLLDTNEKRLQRITELIPQLPPVNYQNLNYLLNFLRHVADHSETNKMNSHNLGVCIGSNLLFSRRKENETSISESYACAHIILQLMIDSYHQLFVSSLDCSSSSSSSSNRKCPDFNSKGRNSSKENLSEISQSSLSPSPTPRTNRKPAAPRAPHPPPPPISIQQSSTHENPSGELVLRRSNYQNRSPENAIDLLNFNENEIDRREFSSSNEEKCSSTSNLRLSKRNETSSLTSNSTSIDQPKSSGEITKF